LLQAPSRGHVHFVYGQDYRFIISPGLPALLKECLSIVKILYLCYPFAFLQWLRLSPKQPV